MTKKEDKVKKVFLGHFFDFNPHPYKTEILQFKKWQVNYSFLQKSPKLLEYSSNLSDVWIHPRKNLLSTVTFCGSSVATSWKIEKGANPFMIITDMTRRKKKDFIANPTKSELLHFFARNFFLPLMMATWWATFSLLSPPWKCLLLFALWAVVKLHANCAI